MSFLFKRYPAPSRRAIFYAHHAALHAGSGEINSTHLLAGLLVEPSTRANLLFGMDKLFREEASRVRALKPYPGTKEIPVSRDGKRILAYAAEEANQLDDYWIDTDHLLGILREHSCTAAEKLAAAGLKIEETRGQVASSSEQRESYGTIPALWRLAKPITHVGRFAGMVYFPLNAKVSGRVQACITRSCAS